MKIIALIMVFLFSNCRSQEKIKTNSNKNETMEIFDINKYKDLKKNPDLYFTENDKSYIDNNKIIRIIDDSITFQVEEKQIDKPNTSTKVYFKDSNKLCSYVNRFYSIAVGVSEEFDRSGKLVKQINFDENYNFSIEDLIKKMNLDFGINILDMKRISFISRFFPNMDITKPIYELRIYFENDSQRLDSFLINGNNGDLLFRKTTFPDEKKGSLYSQYIDSIKR